MELTHTDIEVLKQINLCVAHVGPMSMDLESGAKLESVRSLARAGLAEWRTGKGYGITDAGREALRTTMVGK